MLPAPPVLPLLDVVTAARIADGLVSDDVVAVATVADAVEAGVAVTGAEVVTEEAAAVAGCSEDADL